MAPHCLGFWWKKVVKSNFLSFVQFHSMEMFSLVWKYSGNKTSILWKRSSEGRQYQLIAVTYGGVSVHGVVNSRSRCTLKSKRLLKNDVWIDQRYSIVSTLLFICSYGSVQSTVPLCFVTLFQSTSPLSLPLRNLSILVSVLYRPLSRYSCCSAKVWSNTWIKHTTEKNKPSLVSAPTFRVTDQSTVKCHQFENCNFNKDLYGEWARLARSVHLPYKTS